MIVSFFSIKRSKLTIRKTLVRALITLMTADNTGQIIVNRTNGNITIKQDIFPKTKDKLDK